LPSLESFDIILSSSTTITKEITMKKTTTSNKLKMKKMFAAVQTIVDREDPEDSTFEIIGVYASKKTAETALAKAKQKFLNDVPCDDDQDPEDMLLDDEDRTYDWYVTQVNVEV
jgi:hypothetical protein